jgi:hypothetical protein
MFSDREVSEVFRMNSQRDEEMLTRGLRALAEEMETLAAPDELETKLLQTFRARRVVIPFARRQLNSRYWLIAVAAMLLVAIGVVVFRWNRDTIDTPHQAVKHTVPQKKPENDTSRKDVEYQAVNLPVKTEKRKPARHAASRRPENTQLANHVTNEIATDFIPLSYMNVASLQDGGQIIRVELPRSALANFGLPINMDRYNEKVKADVLLGVDGLAHAIRFVQ